MIAIIAAVSNNHVIGKNGKIPWKIKGEQKRFKDLTVGNVVVMGRRTYEEIGKPLPDRTTVVVSSSVSYEAENCITVKTFNEALTLFQDKDIYISGGSEIYKEALPYAEVLYLTEIDMIVDGDVYFPDFDKDRYIKTVDEIHEGEISWRYVTYRRITDGLL